MSTKHTMGEEWKDEFDKKFTRDYGNGITSSSLCHDMYECDGESDKEDFKDLKDFISSILSHQREQVANDLKAICNRCKTERGLAKAIGNYLLTLKNKDNE